MNDPNFVHALPRDMQFLAVQELRMQILERISLAPF